MHAQNTDIIWHWCLVAKEVQFAFKATTIWWRLGMNPLMWNFHKIWSCEEAEKHGNWEWILSSEIFTLQTHVKRGIDRRSCKARNRHKVMWKSHMRGSILPEDPRPFFKPHPLPQSTSKLFFLRSRTLTIFLAFDDRWQ